MNLNLPQILPPDFKPFWKRDLSIEEYHQDRNFISSTSVRLFLESPLHFYWFFVLGRDIKVNKSMEFGNLAHICILEPKRFREKYIVMPDFDSFDAKGNPSESKNTTYYKNQVAQWKANQSPDAIIVTTEEFQKLEWMLESITRHKGAKFLLKDGIPEMSGYFRDPITGIGCRIRPDFLKYSLKAMVDLKTCLSPENGSFRSQISKRNYDAQLSMYNHGFQMIEGHQIDAAHFLAVQNEAPYDTCVWTPDDGMLDLGWKKYRFALEGIAECMKTNNWPGYQPDGLPQNIGPSEWDMRIGAENYERSTD